MKKLNQDKIVAGSSISEILKRFDKKLKIPQDLLTDGKKNCQK